jgi:hypothetical protein
MKFFKFLLFIIIGIFILTGICIVAFLNAPARYQNQIAKFAFDRSLNYFTPEIKIGSVSLDLNNNAINIQNTFIDLDGLQVNINNLDLTYKMQNSMLNFDVNFTDIFVNEQKIAANFHVQYESYLNFKGKSLLIKSFDQSEDQKESICHIDIKNNATEIKTCDLRLKESTLNLSGDILSDSSGITDLRIKADFNELLLQDYKFFKIFVKDDSVFDFWDDFVRGGNASGNLSIDLKKSNDYEITENNLSGEIFLNDTTLKYDPDLPDVKNVKAKILIKGDSIDCQILGGNANKINVQNGKIGFVWKGKNDSVIDVDLNINGPASIISDFINDEQKLKLKNKDVDFSKTIGNLDSNIVVRIFLADEIPNIVNIRGNIGNFKLTGFKNKAELDKANLKFVIDRKSIAVEGSGMINNYLSQLKYTQDIPYTNSQIAADIELKNLPHHNVDFISFDGNAVLHVLYTDSNNVTSIKADADLTKIGIAVNKLNIFKEKGIKCFLNIGSDPKTSNLNFKISGNDKFNAEGLFNHNEQSINLKYFNSPNMDLSGKAKFAAKKIIGQFSGKYLNLADYNLFNLAKKGQGDSHIELDVAFNKIMLKNNILVNNFDFTIKCSNGKCFEGKSKAYIADKPITMLLTSKDSQEDWDLTSQDAGSFFKGLGIYNKIKNGSMLLKISTKRSTVKSGEIIPIMQGGLVMENFTAIKTPFLTKIVSFTSLPGLLSFVTNSNEIKFDKLNAKFDFNTEKLNILNCDVVGPSFDFMAKGVIDFPERTVKLKGAVVPSIYGVNTLLKNIPVIGQVLYSGKRKGIILAPLSIKEKY